MKASESIGFNKFKDSINVLDSVYTDTTHFVLKSGSRRYELTNHLGNVLSVISDKVIPHDDGSGNVDYWQADVLNVYDYSPFGVMLDGRTFEGGSYRYGFNGQERDDQVSGKGNSYTAEFWQYSSRLARRWNTDKIVKPWESPYAVFRNNPIYFADPDGNDGIATIKKKEDYTNKKGKIIKGGSRKNPHEMTIKANYYYNANTINGLGAGKALNDAIDAYNNSDYTVKGKDGQYYQVKFELTAIPVNEAREVDIYRNHVEPDKYQELPLGNLLSIDIPNFNDRLDENELGAASSRSINLKSDNINKAVNNGANMAISLFNIFIHEIGHNLGGSHEDGGAMNMNVTNDNSNTGGINTFNDYEPKSFRYSTIKNSVTKNNVQAIVNTVWGGGHQEGRPGQVQETK